MTIRQKVGDQLELFWQKFSLYFLQSLSDACNQQNWIVSPFIMQYVQDSNLDGKNKNILVDRSQDIEKKVNGKLLFRIFG